MVNEFDGLLIYFDPYGMEVVSNFLLYLLKYYLKSPRTSLAAPS